MDDDLENTIEHFELYQEEKFETANDQYFLF